MKKDEEVLIFLKNNEIDKAKSSVSYLSFDSSYFVRSEAVDYLICNDDLNLFYVYDKQLDISHKKYLFLIKKFITNKAYKLTTFSIKKMNCFETDHDEILDTAIRSSSIEIIKFLIDYFGKDKFYYNSLFLAASYEKYNLFKSLYNEKRDYNPYEFERILMEIVIKGDIDIFKFTYAKLNTLITIKDIGGLFYREESYIIEAYSFLIENNFIDMNRDINLSLTYACSEKKLKLATLILQHTKPKNIKDIITLNNHLNMSKDENLSNEIISVISIMIKDEYIKKELSQKHEFFYQDLLKKTMKNKVIKF